MNIGNPEKMEHEMEEIEDHNKYDPYYRIRINLKHHSTSLEYKMKLMKMVNELGGDKRVGRVIIRLDSKDEWDEEIMRTMMDRYQNIYHIYVLDYNDSVDSQMHGLI